MKVQLVSDMHCEFYTDDGASMLAELPVAGDVLVVAGDLATYKCFVKVIGALCKKFPEVVFVPGNHEYYLSDRGTLNNNMAKLQRRYSNFHPLNNSITEIAGQRFVGTTGWFPLLPDNWAYQQRLNDFRTIRAFKKWVYDVHNASRKFLLENVTPTDIVVTHHAPTSLSVPSRFKGDSLNRFYVSQFNDVIIGNKPKLWFHGHMHEPCDYVALETRVIANPKGYPREHRKFVPDFVIEI